MEPMPLEGSGHALDNALVLQRIFRELALSGNLEDRKNARLVTTSSNWQAELQDVWRREAMLTLDQGDEPPLPGTTLIEFLDKLKALDSPYFLGAVPYQRIKLQNMSVRLDIDSPVVNLWNAVGPSVKHLTLHKVTLDMTTLKQDLLLLLKANFPNLESLRVDQVTQSVLWKLFKKGIPSPGHRVTLDKVTNLELGSGRSVRLKFDNFPNLQDVKLFGTRSLEDLTNGPVTVVPLVKKLDLLQSQPLTDRQWWITNRLHFPKLEHLTARISGEPSKSFLNGHSATLKTLELFRSLTFRVDFDLSLTYDPILTEFPFLTTLRLWGNVTRDLSFLRFTPNLQVLHWDVYAQEKDSDMWDEIRRRRLCHGDMCPMACLITDPTRRLMEGVELSKLEYCHIGRTLNDRDVGTLAKWMPNLKTFNAVLYYRGVIEVCKHWEKLENLTCLYGSRISDQEILQLRDFKHLKSFSFFPECDGSTLSDACVNQGFLQMAQLTKLHIFVSDQFSEASEQLLRERIPDVKICRHNSQEKLDCCRMLEYHDFIFYNEDDMYVYEPVPFWIWWDYYIDTL